MRIKLEIGEHVRISIEHGEYAAATVSAVINLSGRNSITLAELRGLISRLDSNLQQGSKDGFWPK